MRRLLAASILQTIRRQSGPKEEPIGVLRRSIILAFLAAMIAWALPGCKREQPAVTATSQPSAHGQVRIAAAADLRYALDELMGEFRKSHPAIDITATYGSSGNFFTQLSNKAPFDLFLSADASYPRKLVDQGQASSTSLFHYAVGRIVVWAPNDSKVDVKKLGLTALTDPSVKKIAIANPQHAPYGRAAVAAIQTAGIYDSVKDHLVLGENISQTAQFVASGSADVGIIALSLALAPPIRDKGQYWYVPTDTYPPLDQAGVILNWAADPPAANAFRAFLLSDAGRSTMQRFGFSAPRS